MLTTDELWDMPNGVSVLLVMYKPGERYWIPISKQMVPLRKKEFVRSGRLSRGMTRHAKFIFDHEIGVHWEEKGWCDMDSVAMAVFCDEAHLDEYEKQKKEQYEQSVNELCSAVDSQFKELFGEDITVKFE